MIRPSLSYLYIKKFTVSIISPASDDKEYWWAMKEAFILSLGSTGVFHILLAERCII
jgi:hypothetical protein